MLQALMEQTLDYESFVSTMKPMIKKRMGEGYDVRIYKVIKNNSLELDSLVVLKEDRNIAPNIYLKPYYKSYLEGVSLEEVAERMCMICSNYGAPAMDTDFSYTLREMKSYIFYRLVSYDRNSRLLQSIPHSRYLDLAITFHCLVRNDEEGIGTIRITNDHMKLWGITLAELKEYAAANTEKLFPASIKSMEEVLMGMLMDVRAKDEEEITELKLNQYLDRKEEPLAQPRMYVLSNQKGINGASCILYENTIRQFALRMKSDLFLLPSSIHEVIIIPNDSTMDKEALMDMVRDVNCSQVAEDEVLSDRVYYYSLQSNAIEM